MTTDFIDRFCGTWELDLKASDSMDRILELQGVNFLARQLVKNFKVTQTIERQGDKILFTVKNVRGSQVYEFFINGQSQQLKEGIEASIQLDAATETFISDIEMETPKGKILAEVKRHLSEDDPSTLVQRMTLTDPVSGESHTLDRIFRRRQ